MWAELVYGDKRGGIPETVPDSASHLEEPDIPAFYKRDKEAEATAKKADVYVRFVQRC